MSDVLNPSAESPMDQFRNSIQNAYPGGKHVIGHLDDGPYRLVPTSGPDGANWLAAEALEAYPHWRLPVADAMGNQRWLMDVWLVPDFVSEILHWYNDCETLTVEVEAVAGPYPNKPTPAEWAGALTGLAYFTDPDVEETFTATLQRIVDAGHLDGLLEFCSLLEPEDYEDDEALLAAVTAFEHASG